MAGRPVSWSSWAEWDRVREGILSSGADEVAAAAARIRTWRLRGRVPLSADVTETLLSSQSRDAAISGAAAPAAVGTATLQAEYALAIVRFVNGISDASQKGRVAASVAKNAEAAGLHPVLVEVRHSATHNHLPSLPLLRLAAAHALQWLRDSYWAGQRAFRGAGRKQVADSLHALWRNQCSRSRVAHGSATAAVADGPSSSDDNASPRQVDGVPLGSAQAGAAALKREQRSLLGALRAAAHATRAEDIAAVLAECAVAGLATPHDEEERQIGGDRATRSSFHSNVLVLLETQLTRFSAHVLLAAAKQCASLLSGVMAALREGQYCTPAAESLQQVERCVLLRDAALVALQRSAACDDADKAALAAEWSRCVGGALSARAAGVAAAEHACALRACLVAAHEAPGGFVQLLCCERDAIGVAATGSSEVRASCEVGT